jgi:hypothetical protein
MKVKMMFNILKQGIMKKTFILRTIAASVLLTLFAYGTNAQNILTDYEEAVAATYQTAGTDLRLYVEPDLVYSPGWVPAANAPIGATARWTWTYPVALTGAPASATATNQNFVEFTGVAAGTYTIDVAESNTLGSCAGATVSQTLTVINAPSAVITTADPAQGCGDAVAMNVNVQITEAIPVAFAGYAFGVNELIENITPADVVIGAALVDATLVDWPTTGKLNTGNDLTGGASPYGYQFPTAALTVRNGLRTRYTYTLIGASDAASDGIISAISEKSDYLAGTVTVYPFGADIQIVIIRNPQPTTGPIYHIPNNFAY